MVQKQKKVGSNPKPAWKLAKTSARTPTTTFEWAGPQSNDRIKVCPSVYRNTCIRRLKRRIGFGCFSLKIWEVISQTGPILPNFKLHNRLIKTCRRTGSRSSFRPRRRVLPTGAAMRRMPFVLFWERLCTCLAYRAPVVCRPSKTWLVMLMPPFLNAYISKTLIYLSNFKPWIWKKKC